jgi:hypothetical protein
MTIQGGSAAAPSLTFSGDTNTGVFFPAADTVAIATGGTQRLTVNSAGNTQTVGTISVGNATPSTSGAGITFPATQSASSDANTLDDYEEGTWTPIFAGSGADPTGVTYAVQRGIYTKIGKVVNVSFYLAFSTYTGGSGSFYIGGLPFAVGLNADAEGAIKIENATLTAGRTYATVAALNNVAYLAPYQNGSNTTWITMTIGTAFTSSATIKYFTGSITYFI